MRVARCSWWGGSGTRDVESLFAIRHRSDGRETVTVHPRARGTPSLTDSHILKEVGGPGPTHDGARCLWAGMCVSGTVGGRRCARRLGRVVIVRFSDGGKVMLLLLACLVWVTVALTPPKDVYRVGIDVPWAVTDFSLTFGAYLTSSVGSLYYPSVTFTTAPFRASISESGSVADFDFVFARPETVSCLEEDSDMTPILTLKAKHGSSASALVGGVLFTSAQNGEINLLADISGKRVSSNSVGRGTAFLSVSERLRGAGVSLVQDAGQLVFSPSALSSGVIADVLNGRADAGIVETGALEQEAASNAAFSLAQVKVIEALAGPSGFPFVRSTDLYPQWALASKSNVDRGVIASVVKALLSLTSSSPQAVAGGYASFTVAASYEPIRSLHAKQGVLDSLGGCKSVGPGAYSSVLCPVDTYAMTAPELQGSCSACPAGPQYQCVCKPCLPGGDVDIFSDGKRCFSWDLCGATAPQGTERTFYVVDNLRRAHANFSYALVRAQGASTQGLCTYANDTERLKHRCRITLMEDVRGAHTMRILLNGSEVPSAVHRILVSRGGADKCVAGKLTSRFVLNDLGECVCERGSLQVAGGACMRSADLIPMIVILPAFAVLAYFFLVIKREKKKFDFLWKIEFRHVQVVSESLGTGTFGQVLRGDFKGRPVAIKRAVPTAEDMVQFLSAQVQDGRKSSIDSIVSAATPQLSFFRSTSLANKTLRPSTKKGDEEAPNEKARKIASNQIFGASTIRRSSVGDTGPEFAGSVKDTAAQIARRHGMVDDFVHEMRYVARLRHPCIVSVLGAVIEAGITPLVVMEICETGSLADLIHNSTFELHSEQLLPILRDIVRGMHFLHVIEPPIVHGDLRTQKVLMDSTFRAKVTDYGFSQKRKLNLELSRPSMSPELLLEGVPTKSSDVYAFGVLMCEVLSRQEPYVGANLEYAIREVIDLNKEPPTRPAQPEGLPENVRLMMNSCWHKHAVMRPSFEELANELQKMTMMEMQEVALKRRQRHKQTSHTLYSVFPKHIADQLAEGKKVAPERKEAVTIFFSDIVGFTDISGTFPPEKVSNMLDRLYTKFDALADYHDIFKVETIGDAYMAVSNLVKNQNKDHCARIARFALAAVQQARETLIDEDDPARGTVNIRVGFHTGPVLANVVGTRNPRYCLFGDTVITANKMESNGVMWRVHCTRKAADVLRQQAPGMLIEERGSINIKGRGDMVTFWVNGEDEAKSQEVKAATANVIFQFADAASKFKNMATRRPEARKKEDLSLLLGRAPSTRIQRVRGKMKILQTFAKMRTPQVTPHLTITKMASNKITPMITAMDTNARSQAADSFDEEISPHGEPAGFGPTHKLSFFAAVNAGAQIEEPLTHQTSLFRKEPVHSSANE